MLNNDQVERPETRSERKDSMRKPRTAEIYLACNNGLWTWFFTIDDGWGGHRIESATSNTMCSCCIIHARVIAKLYGFTDVRVVDVCIQ